MRAIFFLGARQRRRGGSWVLPIFGPASPGDVHGVVEQNFGEENLILEHGAKGGIEAPHSLDGAAAHQRIAGGGRLMDVAEQLMEKRRSGMSPSGFHAEAVEIIALI